ncbi:hypothetical protein J3Q64DRAFT_1769408 [Phycomyces blakesleeanus]|uniref:Uncharacterized protein n=1 Tax=Phycomyces blakesleeanus TaxID=4837 RepID=A0ABR3AN90_PHYBL
MSLTTLLTIFFSYLSFCCTTIQLVTNSPHAPTIQFHSFLSCVSFMLFIPYDRAVYDLAHFKKKEVHKYSL